ncbi:hypothetical protein D3C87_1781130 [compost metagenome]
MSASGASAKVLRRLPMSVALANFFFTSPISQATVCHCFSSEASSASISAFSFDSASNSVRISNSSSLRKERSRMLRIDSAWRSVSENRSIITAFGSSSSRMMRMTSSILR